jgi:hypothetical protein
MHTQASASLPPKPQSRQPTHPSTTPPPVPRTRPPRQPSHPPLSLTPVHHAQVLDKPRSGEDEGAAVEACMTVDGKEAPCTPELKRAKSAFDTLVGVCVRVCVCVCVCVCKDAYVCHVPIVLSSKCGAVSCELITSPSLRHFARCVCCVRTCVGRRPVGA